jgi:hypothetical protein
MHPRRLSQAGQASPSVALALGIWFAPIPAGLARDWHLRRFRRRGLLGHRERISALTSSLLAVGAVVLTGTVDPAKARRLRELERSSGRDRLVACGGKSGLGSSHQLARGEHHRTVRSLAYSIFLTDALIAGVSEQYGARRHALPILLCQNAGSRPKMLTRAWAVIMFCGMAS